MRLMVKANIEHLFSQWARLIEADTILKNKKHEPQMHTDERRQSRIYSCLHHIFQQFGRFIKPDAAFIQLNTPNFAEKTTISRLSINTL